MVNAIKKRPDRHLIQICEMLPRSSLESRHRPTGGRWFTVQISRGPNIKVGSRDL